MSEYDLLNDISTRLGIWKKKLATAPDTDTERVISDLEADKERLERKLFPDKFAVAVQEPVIETVVQGVGAAFVNAVPLETETEPESETPTDETHKEPKKPRK